ncbi:MAG: hypothetical protein Q9180_009179, partial [Flavoplaca navasiana]
FDARSGIYNHQMLNQDSVEKVMGTVGLLGIPSGEALMQSMLPHEQTRNGTHSRQTEYRPEDIGQGIHVGVFRPRHPAIVG